MNGIRAGVNEIQGREDRDQDGEDRDQGGEGSGQQRIGIRAGGEWDQGRRRSDQDGEDPDQGGMGLSPRRYAAGLKSTAATGVSARPQPGLLSEVLRDRPGRAAGTSGIGSTIRRRARRAPCQAWRRACARHSERRHRGGPRPERSARRASRQRRGRRRRFRGDEEGRRVRGE